MRKLKNLMFYIALAVALALPMGMTAQERGLFSTSPVSNETSGSRSLMNQNQNRANQLSSDGLGNQGFNQVPLGSGVAMLIAAGAGYAVIKKKKSKKSSITF